MTVRSFKVTLTVEGTVLADNAGQAVAELSDLVRQGLGTDMKDRKFGAIISHGAAEYRSVFIPEKPEGK